MISEYYKRIKENVERKFSDILMSAELIQGAAGRIRKLRLYLIDNTFVDIWYSPDGSYSYHWEQRDIRDAIYVMITLLIRNGEMSQPFPNIVMMASS
jgi:hypothetical protein